VLTVRPTDVDVQRIDVHACRPASGRDARAVWISCRGVSEACDGGRSASCRRDHTPEQCVAALTGRRAGTMLCARLLAIQCVRKPGLSGFGSGREVSAV
jgi:hypothetical protein